jgi:hypothetical protein
MFEKKLAQIIISNLTVEPTASQLKASEAISRFSLMMIRVQYFF